MKIDAGLLGGLEEVPARIREFEEQGFDGVVTAELGGDPFFPLVLAAEHSERVELMTSIAVAFARSPMNLASKRSRRSSRSRRTIATSRTFLLDHRFTAASITAS